MVNRITRRQALQAVTAGTVALSHTGQAAVEQPAAAEQGEGACVLMAEATEGPFYFDPKLERRDITEGRPGAPLNLALTIIEAGPCTPITNARVDVWHCDADGLYSGYARQDTNDTSTKGQTFLRGTQTTGSDGRVTFETIYPGWYPGRTPHIHVKILLDQKTIVTAQMYFPELLSRRIYGERDPYTARGNTPDTTNSNDGIFKSSGGESGGVMLAIAGVGDVLTGSLVIAIDRSRTSAQGGWMQWLRGKIGPN